MIFQEFFKLGMNREMNEILDFPKGKILNIGAGNKIIQDTVSLDFPEWDADKQQIPFEDNSIAGIHCYHFLEHVKYPVKVLQEFQRVLTIGGIINIVVPYYASQMQYQDLDHKNSFCEETWKTLFSNNYYDKNKIIWRFSININFICAIKERNLALFTQLIKIENKEKK